MSQKDSSSKIKAQPAGGSSTRRTGSTRYKMQAAQLAQQEAAKAQADMEAAAVQQERLKAEKLAQAESDAQSEDNVRGLWKSRVLASYKGKSPKDSSTLLARVPEGKAALQVSEHYKAVNIQEVMISTVDKMFDIFQNCAYAFNKMAAGSELELNWIRPFLSKEATNNWHAQQEAGAIIFSGRISTRRWTMVVKGTIEEVLVFILPADKLIGFALSHKNFKPYLAMTPVPDTLDVKWLIEETILPPDAFPAIYKELFDALIRFAREEARLDETFSLTQIGIKPTVEVKEVDDGAMQRMYQEAFFQDMQSRREDVPNFAKPGSQMDSGGWMQVPDIDSAQLEAETRAQFDRRAEQVNTGSQQPSRPSLPPQHSLPQRMTPPPMPPQMAPQPPMPQQHLAQQHLAQQQHMAQQHLAHQHVPQPQTPQQQMPQQQMPQQQMPQQQMPQQQMPQQQMPQQQMPQQQMPQQQMPQQQMHQPQMPQQQMPQQQMPQQQMPQQQMPQQQMPQQQMPQQQSQRPKPASFPESLHALLSVLDTELEVVAKAGSDAFAQRDLARADAALKFSGRLTEFRSLAKELLEYYGFKP